jgi:hypothetical protein
MVQRSMGRMAESMTEAVGVLRQLLGAESKCVRLGAARALLDLGVKLRQSVELEECLLGIGS